MAGADIRFDLSQLVAMDGRLEAAFQRSLDPSPLFDAIGGAMETTTEERFASESGPDGNKWKPSDMTRKRTKKTLTEDGHLGNSISHIFGRDFTQIGSNLEYARAHNQGYAEGGLPQRQFLGIGGDDEQTILELTADFYLQDLAA